MFNLFKNTGKELEKAKQALIDSLQNGSIEYLLAQMDNHEIYSDLLQKKREKETSNTDNVYWYAYRRAEMLTNPADKTALLDILRSTTDDVKKQHIYFCLAHYCKNTLDNSLFNYLVEMIEVEKDSNIKRSILIGIANMSKDASLNIEPIKKLCKVRNSTLRRQAIAALRNTNDETVEDLLLTIFNDTKDSSLKSTITITLETTGTVKSIPALQDAHKKTRDYGLRGYIERTIEKIEREKCK